MTIETGRYGMAELVPADANTHTVESWVVTTRFWHHRYTQYWLLLISLRDFDKMASPPPTLDVEGATHAVASVTLDPAHPYQEGEHMTRLDPINLEAQFACANDELARWALRQAVDEVLEGNLNPESGTRVNLNVQEWRDFLQGVVA